MSHFTVAVFTKKGQRVEDLLEPYDENTEVEPYVRRTKKEILDEIEEFCKDHEDLRNKYANLSDKEKMIRWEGDDEFDEDGNPLSTYNPNSKWDWYDIGGRWNNLLTTKDGKNTNRCLVKDLDLTLDEEKYNEAIRFWEVVVEDQPLKDGEKEPFNLYKKEYYLEYYKDKETYAKICASFGTFAVITPDGEWHEKGEMGWFGFSSETGDESLDLDLNYYERFIEKVNPNWTITIVDCHI